MNCLSRFAAAFAVALCLVQSAVSHAAELSGSPVAADPTRLHFKNMPDLPRCLTVGVVAGDPMSGPSVVLLQFAPGCDSTMHWHSPNEQLVMVKGSGTLQMRGEAAKPVTVGAYNFQPSKHPHRFVCGSGRDCLLYLSSDAKFDIHYVDNSGNEISLAQAVSGSKKM